MREGSAGVRSEEDSSPLFVVFCLPLLAPQPAETQFPVSRQKTWTQGAQEELSKQRCLKVLAELAATFEC